MSPAAARKLALAFVMSAVVAGCGTAEPDPGPATSAGSRVESPVGPKRAAEAGDVQFAAVPAGVDSVQVTFVTGRCEAAGLPGRPATGAWFRNLAVLPATAGETEAVPAGVGVLGRTYPPGDVTVKLWPSRPGEWLENAVPVVATPGRPLALDLSDFQPAADDVH